MEKQRRRSRKPTAELSDAVLATREHRREADPELVAELRESVGRMIERFATERERRVWVLIQAGHTAESIAEILGVSVRTARRLVTRVNATELGE